MVRETYEIMVEVLDCIDKETAIATASAYLAYGDQTETFGYAPTIDSVRVHSDGDGPTAVTITTTLTIASDTDRKRFMDELARLSKVVSVERE